jgi:hypothetical protein
MVAGGEQVYREALPHADQVTVTRVAGRFDCDTFFPEDLIGHYEIAHFNHPFSVVFTFLVNSHRGKIGFVPCIPGEDSFDRLRKTWDDVVAKSAAGRV